MDERYDVLIVGAGLSGLTAAALLAKRGLSVLVLERCCQPGGSCGAFRRRGYTLDLGAAMLFGFGERGFNPHRFVMNELEESLDVYRHEAMYRLHYPDAEGRDRPVVFWPEKERFFDELARLFPSSIGELKSLYRDLEGLYKTVMSANSVFLSPSETPKAELIRGLLAHPISEARLLRLMTKSAGSLMRRHVKDEAIYRFFDKLTSTYTYTSIEETPALLAVTMFVENHVGGSYYPAGSPMMLAAKLEKALERRGGSIRYSSTVSRILVEGGRAGGVELESGEKLFANKVLYSGTVWNLYERLLPSGLTPPELLAKVRALEPSFPSSVLYGAVASEAIPKGAFPVEMLIGNPEQIDESDLTLYLSSLEDPSLARPGYETFMLIGPSAAKWPSPSSPEYQGQAYNEAKEREAERMLSLVESRFPGFRAGVLFSELGSPSTIERYLMKNGGAVAGPKQRMGQELMNRQAAATFLPGLFMCGESTVMGTGTPAVTISGISAADLILREEGLPEYRNRPSARQYVRVIPRGQEGNRPSEEAFRASTLCQWCETSPCRKVCPAGIDIMGIMRRLEAGNALGAAKALRATDARFFGCASCAERPCVAACVREAFDDRSVPIPELLSALAERA
jgi:prolycopene isomerase